jgi:4-hydroxy-3-methylbut-2-en-1-yl diphosphate reductase
MNVEPLVERILVASPRGYCAGVERAVATVERAIALWGPGIYVRRQIVHNVHVVARLEELGAIFVESENDVPTGATVVFSAHGVAPSVYDNAAARGLRVIDATCPLVTKVHSEARHYAARDFTLLVIGHRGHDEVEGTMGVAPEESILVESREQVEALELDRDTPVAYLTQTTLSVDDTADIVAAIKRRFPRAVGPHKADICYATSNRQAAVKALLDETDFVLVIGSTTSSNSNRLVEVARTAGVGAELIDDERDIDERWLDGVRTLGLTAGASAPEWLVEGVCSWFRQRGVADIEQRSLVAENVEFRAPVEVRSG